MTKTERKLLLMTSALTGALLRQKDVPDAADALEALRLHAEREDGIDLEMRSGDEEDPRDA